MCLKHLSSPEISRCSVYSVDPHCQDFLLAFPLQDLGCCSMLGRALCRRKFKLKWESVPDAFLRFTCILSSPAPSLPPPPLHSPSAPRRMCVFFLHFTPGMLILHYHCLPEPHLTSTPHPPCPPPLPAPPIRPASNHPWRGNSICTVCFISTQI